MCNVLKYCKMTQNVSVRFAVRLRLFFQLTYVQYCSPVKALFKSSITCRYVIKKECDARSHLV